MAYLAAVDGRAGLGQVGRPYPGALYGLTMRMACHGRTIGNNFCPDPGYQAPRIFDQLDGLVVRGADVTAHEDPVSTGDKPERAYYGGWLYWTVTVEITRGGQTPTEIIKGQTNWSLDDIPWPGFSFPAQITGESKIRDGVAPAGGDTGGGSGDENGGGDNPDPLDPFEPRDPGDPDPNGGENGGGDPVPTGGGSPIPRNGNGNGDGNGGANGGGGTVTTTGEDPKRAGAGLMRWLLAALIGAALAERKGK